MATLTGGDVLVEALIAQGVTDVFGIPGIQLDGATDALYRHQDAIRFVGVRNEQAATYMADGYARVSADVGVAMVVPGPGVLNALAGLATAYAANSPVLLIAGQINSQLIGKGLGMLHELPDQCGVLDLLTQRTLPVRAVADIPAAVAEAFRLLRSDLPQPVALDVPADVLLAAAPEGLAIAPRVPHSARAAAPSDVAAAVELLAAATHPVIYAGGGIRASQAQAELTELAEALGAPVVVTDDGRGAIDARHPLAFDQVAFRQLRASADVVVAVGTRFITGMGSWVNSGDARVIMINTNPDHLFGPQRRPDLAILADARTALAQLTAALPSRHVPDRTAELTQVQHEVDKALEAIAPQREYLAVIRQALGEDGILVSEFTQVGYAASACFPTYFPQGHIWPGYQGTLGYGFATALGAQRAAGNRKVISINGDGGFAWTMQELSTMAHYQLPLITVVFHDGFYGNVRRIQRNDYGARYIGTDLTNPDYPTLAAAFGIESHTVYSPQELGTVLAEMGEPRRPVLIDIPVGEFPSPWHLIHEGIPTPAPLAPGADRVLPDSQVPETRKLHGRHEQTN